MRTFFIGDIHGGYLSLLQCLERSSFDKQEDTLIVGGDVADGNPETAEVVEELLTIKNLIPLMGNHDKWCYDWLKYGITPPSWLQQGGQATYDSYAVYNANLMLKHEKEYFAKCHLYYVDEQNRGFVHGGFVSKHGLGHEAHASNYYWDRDLWSLAMMSHGREDLLGTDQSRRMLKHTEIFIGHTATTYWKTKPHFPEYNDPNQAKNGKITVPMNRCNIWNVDTGGGYSGKLTIMDIDTKEYWQSDSLDELYYGHYLKPKLLDQLNSYI